MCRILFGNPAQLFRKRVGAKHSLSGQLADPRQQGAGIVEGEDRTAH
jgi:hypothetical protein